MTVRTKEKLFTGWSTGVTGPLCFFNRRALIVSFLGVSSRACTPISTTTTARSEGAVHARHARTTQTRPYLFADLHRSGLCFAVLLQRTVAPRVKQRLGKLTRVV